MSSRIILLASTFLSLTCLFMPFVWMEIGPLGFKNYGPTIPDVYIYGGTITGKDFSFWGIRFAVGFQLIFMLLFSALSLIALFVKSKAIVLALLSVQSLLLALFPLWLKAYVNGVECNSDGADLTIHYQIGMIFYGILIGLNIFGFIQTARSKKFNKIE